ncbi:MAG: hypothetical protein AB7U71_23785 [Comamonas sp.]
MTTITHPAGDACNHERVRLQEDSSVLHYMFKYVLRSLHPDVLGAAAGNSGKDGVAAFAHSDRIHKLILQLEVFEDRDGIHELTHPGSNEVAVDLPCLIANPNDHVVSTASPFIVGFGFDLGHYVLIVGAWNCTLNELRLHSSLSDFDVELLRFAARQLHKPSCAEKSGKQPSLIAKAVADEMERRQAVRIATQFVDFER